MGFIVPCRSAEGHGTNRMSDGFGSLYHIPGATVITQLFLSSKIKTDAHAPHLTFTAREEFCASNFSFQYKVSISAVNLKACL